VSAARLIASLLGVAFVAAPLVTAEAMRRRRKPAGR